MDLFILVCYFWRKFGFWGHFGSVFDFVFVRGRLKKKKKAPGAADVSKFGQGYFRLAGAWHSQTEPPRPVSWTHPSLFSPPKGLDRLPRIPRSQRREGHTGKSCFGWLLRWFFPPEISPWAGLMVVKSLAGSCHLLVPGAGCCWCPWWAQWQHSARLLHSKKLSLKIFQEISLNLNPFLAARLCSGHEELFN